MRSAKIILALFLGLALMLNIAACTSSATTGDVTQSGSSDSASTDSASADPASQKNGEIYILYTSDIHCGIDEGFGLAGLYQVRSSLEAQGYTTILVDNGDAIQGEPIGTLSRGEAIIELMNAMKYDIAIPGNHEFDYGADHFVELAGQADFPYISCNFLHLGERVFEPYVILERCGIKIGFVGVTTPKTIGESSPAHFQNEAGEYVYEFMHDQTGKTLYAAVQEAVDSARSAGAELVYVLGHCGMDAEAQPWTYADIISHTRGINVFLDGHSHDTEQILMKNLDGEEVFRSACGTKLQCIGYSHISAEGEVLETGIWSWPNKIGMPSILGIDNEMSVKVAKAMGALEVQMGEVIAKTPFDLTIYDPVEKDSSGNPIRMVRRAETNMGDLFADAFRDQGQADVAMVNGGGVRISIDKGDITYGDILSLAPFGNMLCVLEVTGQDILDALEWGVRSVPGENGNFPQVSGLSFEVDVSIDSPCIEDENEMCAGIQGERRVRNVLVGGEPLDPTRIYTLAGHDYMLLQIADGYTMFRGAPVLQNKVKIDNQVLIDYVQNTLGGVISDEYADPYGQGRIVFAEDSSL